MVNLVDICSNNTLVAQIQLNTQEIHIKDHKWNLFYTSKDFLVLIIIQHCL